MKAEISKFMLSTGFLSGVKYIEDNKQGVLRIYLKYTKSNESVIAGMRRISKPSCRIYTQHKYMPRVLGGYGVAIISTSHGLMSDRAARAAGHGGEVICEIS